MFIFDRMKTSLMTEKAIDAETLRRKVIANNIANADVPNFKRSEVNFESELKRAMECKNDNIPHGKMTDPRHIPFHTRTEISSVKPRINTDYTTTMRNDGNNVDIEKEIVDSAKNQMRYNALIQKLGGAYAALKRIMQPVP
jgi:flagellar basal-body rod protein FlgB